MQYAELEKKWNQDHGDLAATKLLLVGLDKGVGMVKQDVTDFKNEFKNHRHVIGQSEGYYVGYTISTFQVHVPGKGYIHLEGPNDKLEIPLFANSGNPLKTSGPKPIQ